MSILQFNYEKLLHINYISYNGLFDHSSLGKQVVGQLDQNPFKNRKCYLAYNLKIHFIYCILFKTPLKQAGMGKRLYSKGLTEHHQGQSSDFR